MSGIKVFGVIGAGQMGRGIAQVAAQTGWQVLLLDTSRELAEKGRAYIEGAVARLVDRGKISPSDGGSLLSRIRPVADYQELGDVDFVIGYLNTTSFANRRILGDDADAFERDVRETLLAFNLSNRFERVLDAGWVTARKR